MKLFQFAGEGVNIRGGERSSRRESALTFRMSKLTFAATSTDAPDDVQHIQSPAALGVPTFRI